MWLLEGKAADPEVSVASSCENSCRCQDSRPATLGHVLIMKICVYM